MSVTIYVPRDSGALALGADKVAKAIEAEIAAARLDARIVRNGSRGAYFLEPMVEVATDEGRVAYGPVTAKDVASLFDAGFPLRRRTHGCRSATRKRSRSSPGRRASPSRAAASPTRSRSTTTRRMTA